MLKRVYVEYLGGTVALSKAMFDILVTVRRDRSEEAPLAHCIG